MSDVSLSHATGFGLYFRLAYRTFFGSGGTGARLTGPRLVRMARFTAVFFLTEVWNRAWLALDNVLFPGYRSIEVKSPVFVCGVPRCGTTLLHRILADDGATTSFRLWEVLLAPSICQKKFYRFLGRIDRAFGGRLKRRVRANFLRGAEEMRKYHPLDLWEAEEDELILLPYIATAFLVFPFPYPETLRPLMRFDQELAPEARRWIMGRYKALVQRHLYVYGPEKRMLTKNPFMSPKVESLRETFPDARVICNVRTPYEAVPSTISLFRYMTRFFHYNPGHPEATPFILDIVDHFYEHPMARLPEWPADRHAFVRYDDLVADPSGTVEGLYGRLGLPMTEAYAERLAERARECRAYTSKHAYCLDEFGLDEAAIAERYGRVFETFDFPRRGAAMTDAVRKTAVG